MICWFTTHLLGLWCNQTEVLKHLNPLKQSGFKYSSFAKSVDVKQQMPKQNTHRIITSTFSNSAALTRTGWRNWLFLLQLSLIDKQQETDKLYFVNIDKWLHPSFFFPTASLCIEMYLFLYIYIDKQHAIYCLHVHIQQQVAQASGSSHE